MRESKSHQNLFDELIKTTKATQRQLDELRDSDMDSRTRSLLAIKKMDTDLGVFDASVGRKAKKRPQGEELFKLMMRILDGECEHERKNDLLEIALEGNDESFFNMESLRKWSPIRVLAHYAGSHSASWGLRVAAKCLNYDFSKLKDQAILIENFLDAGGDSKNTIELLVKCGCQQIPLYIEDTLVGSILQKSGGMLQALPDTIFAGPEIRDAFGMTHAHHIFSYGVSLPNADIIVKKLLQRGYSLTEQDWQGMTPLHHLAHPEKGVPVGTRISWVCACAELDVWEVRDAFGKRPIDYIPYEWMESKKGEASEKFAEGKRHIFDFTGTPLWKATAELREIKEEARRIAKESLDELVLDDISIELDDILSHADDQATTAAETPDLSDLVKPEANLIDTIKLQKAIQDLQSRGTLRAVLTSSDLFAPANDEPHVEICTVEHAEKLVSTNIGNESKHELERLGELLLVPHNRRKVLARMDIDEELEALAQDMPHFEQAIEFLRDHQALSKIGDNSMRFPPILLAGAPGIGKTYFFHRIAKRSGIPFHVMDMSSKTAGFVISGSSPTWAGGRVGEVAETLIGGRVGNPILFLDELDKGFGDRQSPVDRPLHALLEKDSARTFKDEFINIPLDASHILWVAAANDVDAISHPIRTRFEILHIPTPNKIAQRAMTRSVYRSVRSENPWGGHFPTEISENALDALLKMDETDGAARDMRKTILKAFAKAARNGRKEILPEDVFVSGQEAKSWGFIQQPCQ